MKKEVENILQELYVIDKSLKNKENELIKIINSMIDFKPNVKIDENFKNELRAKIVEQIKAKKLQKFNEEKNKLSLLQIFSYVFWTAWIAAFWFFMFKEVLFQDLDLSWWKQNVKFESTVKVSDKWFWELSDVGKQDNQIWETDMKKVAKNPEIKNKNDNKLLVDNTIKEPINNKNDEVITGSRNKEVKEKNIEDTSIIDIVGMSDEKIDSNDSREMWFAPSYGSLGSSYWDAWISSDMWDMPPSDLSLRNQDEMLSKMIAPAENYTPQVYRYNFSWSLKLDLKSSMPVYKRDNKKVDSEVFAKNIWNMSFAWVWVSNFSNIWVSNITLNEDKDYWYNIFIDFDNSNLSINKNYSKWPESTYVEWEQQVFLEENEIIKIAYDFLNTHKIDLSKYGEPQIDKTYIMNFAKYNSSKIMPAYAQNNTTVVFPLIVDWNEIIEEWWQQAWVRIDIDLKIKKVISLNWLSVDNYLKSYYKTETNTNNILNVANKGWRFGFNDYGTGAIDYIDVNINNPQIKYVHTYSYKDNQSEQYLIPAIVFDVENPENNGNYFGDTIVIPLLKDSYKYDEKGNIIGASE